MEWASGNALQTWTKGPYDTITTQLSGLLSQKNPALSQRVTVIVIKVGRQKQQKAVFARIFAPKFFWERRRFRGQGSWQICAPRPCFLATPSRHGTRQAARKLREALVLMAVCGIYASGQPLRQRRPTIVTKHSCGNRVATSLNPQNFAITIGKVRPLMT